MRILIVDDEPDITKTLVKGLKINGFEIDGYTDPVKAVEEFKANFYDLAILDVRMVGMNGFQVYREIMKRDERIRVWFLSAYEEYRAEFRKAFPELDEERYIKKPVSINDLMKRIILESKI